MPSERPFPPECRPGWDYENAEGHDVVLPQRSLKFLISLKSDPSSHQPLLEDVRPAHSEMFTGLTPAGREYYAGNYRGDDFFCLFGYPVRVKADEYVGCLPEHVEPWMAYFFDQFQSKIASLDAALHARKNNPPATFELLGALVPIAAEILDRFLVIHPFANGNGHMGRTLIFTFFARYGIWPRAWTLDDSPPYSPALHSHRRGDVLPLQQHLYLAVLGPPTQRI